MFWTMLCGRRVADGRWWTSWLTAPSAGWRLNDPKCAPCWPTAAAPGCSSACDRKPLTCPAVFCSNVAGAQRASRPRAGFPKSSARTTRSAPISLRGGVDDPDQQLYENYGCGSPRNYTGYCNPELEQLFDRQSMEANPA